MKFYQLLLLLFLTSAVNAQLETRNWFLHENRIAVTPSGITTGLPNPSNTFIVPYKSTSVSDAAGNLLLAFNGSKIIDRNMNIMPAMTNIDLFASGGKVMIQPVPNSSRYYVFYATGNNSPNYANSRFTLKYALVDLSLNGGNGDVVFYNQVIDTASSPAFTLAQGDDPSQAWLVTHRWATDSFFTYPITSSGLSNTPVISRAGTLQSPVDYIFRDLETSYNGKMIAGMSYRDYTVLFAYTIGVIEVFNFNSLNGIVTSKVRTRRTPGYFFNYFSLEFSPDNRLLYTCAAQRIYGLQPCGFGAGSVQQFNLCYTDSIDFDRYSMHVASDFRFCAPNSSWGTIQMGADKRIHMPYSGTTVSTINFPNRIGTRCDYIFDSYQLPFTNSAVIGVPDFHHKLMEKAIKNNIVYEGNCYPNPIQFRITNDTLTSVEWNFGDPASPGNTSTMISPSHVFSAPGIYTVTAQLYNSQAALIETVKELVEIKDPGRRLLYNYPRDTTFCAGGSIKIRLQVVNGIYTWYESINGTPYGHYVSDSLTIGNSGTWYVEMRQNDCNGCRMIDSIHVTVLPKPNFSLGPDRNLCTGDSLLLAIYDPGADYIWNTGATTNTIWVKQGGLYWVQAEYNNNGCPMRDSILITQVPGVQFSLPADTVLCNSQTLLLDPGVVNANYLWQNGSTQSQFMVIQPGTYWVRVSSANGCIKSDTIQVSYINTQQVNLGNDTALCAGSSLPLQANVNNAAYLWSTGATTQTISVTQTGVYWVSVKNSACTITDTINVTFNTPPVLSLGNDSTICPQQQLLLNPVVANAQYTWQDGSHLYSQTISQPGIYWLELYRGGCTVRDSIVIGYYNVPLMNLGPDTRFCTGDSLALNATPGFIQYAWSNGSNMISTTVHLPGNYSVTGTTNDGCQSKDTLQIASLYPLPVINLGPDTDICTGDTKTLNAGAGFNQYNWSNGSHSSMITVSNTGIYSVQITDQQGCKGTDTIQIRSLLALPKSFLPVDTTICSYGSFTLKPSQLFNQYTWSTGGNNSSVTISQPGVYWLDVKDNNQCRGRDTILVTLKECMQGLFVPSAFTPNNDGRNDDFKPLLFGNVEEYRFTVYNRWGQVVFSTTTPGQGWNGSFGGQPQNTNVFTWLCQYKLKNENFKVEKGIVTLIK